jgi:hypothetical protein
VQDFSAINGKKFKIDPRRLLFTVVPARRPPTRLPFGAGVSTLLLGALIRHDPQ